MMNIRAIQLNAVSTRNLKALVRTEVNDAATKGKFEVSFPLTNHEMMVVENVVNELVEDGFKTSVIKNRLTISWSMED